MRQVDTHQGFPGMHYPTIENIPGEFNRVLFRIEVYRAVEYHGHTLEDVRRAYDVSSIQHLVYGDAACPLGVKQSIHNRYGVPIHAQPKMPFGRNNLGLSG